jgi:hypothetical protein
MTSPILIFIITLFISHSLNCMEIIKKKDPLKRKKQRHYQHPIIADFLVLQELKKESKKRETFPQDLIHQIQKLCIQLRNKDFKDNFLYVDLWNDFQIPFHYHYRLTPEHIKSLQKYFKYKPSYIPYHDEKRLAQHYSFDRKEDYEIFITIPIEIRRYLTQLPKSVQNQKAFPFTNTDINEYKIVRVGYFHKTVFGDTYQGIEGKFIIPEEKNKGIKLDINR